MCTVAACEPLLNFHWKTSFKFSSGWGGGGKGQNGKWGRVEGASVSLMEEQEEEEVFDSLDTFFFYINKNK